MATDLRVSPSPSLVRGLGPTEQTASERVEVAAVTDLREGSSRHRATLAVQRDEESEHRCRFSEPHCPQLGDEPGRKSKSGTLESRRLLVAEEENEFTGVGEADVLELGCGDERLSREAALERSPEPAVRRTVRHYRTHVRT